ncbi:MAG: hypothetical protein NVSMB32_02930 [Actinomycetota bacterium]
MPIFHKFLGAAIVLLFFVLFVWGTLYWIRNRDPGRFFWGLLAVGQVALGVQLLAGITLYLLGSRPPQQAFRWLHYSYGAFALLVLFLAHRISKKFEGVEWAVFAVASFVVFGLLVRAYMTGAGIGVR